ncbi:hypothetical protein FX016_23285 [Cupriavidus gilardii]|nr:hypothetical protein FX016_23285 [Cupriavidus gilardii]
MEGQMTFAKRMFAVAVLTVPVLLCCGLAGWFIAELADLAGMSLDRQYSAQVGVVMGMTLIVTAVIDRWRFERRTTSK